MRTLGILVAVIAVGGGSWLGYSKFIAGGGEDAFILQPVKRGDIIKTISATGTVEPLVKVIVGSQVSGTIKAWNADFNTRVTKDFVLAEIEPDRFLTNHEQAKADLALAVAREEELHVRSDDSEREHKRLEPLYQTNLASENEFLIAKAAAGAAHAAWRGAVASVEAAKARLNAAAVDLEHCIIRSPIDGVVISRDIDVGQTVAASFQTPQLFLIANDLTQMQVSANVAEADIGLISEGLPAQFRVDAYPGRTFAGKIRQIRYNATVLDGVVTYVTLIEVPNDDLALRPGMTANVTVEVAKAENVLRIPTAALRFDPAPRDANAPSSPRPAGRRVPTVYVLENGEAKRCEIQIGLSDGSFTELVAGDLGDGAEVITERNWAGGGQQRADVTRSLRPAR